VATTVAQTQESHPKYKLPKFQDTAIHEMKIYVLKISDLGGNVVQLAHPRIQSEFLFF
jgi:hypothetical protein